MADLRTRYLGLELQSPLVASSSPLTGSLDGLRKLEAAGAGAVVLPSLFEEELAEDPGRVGADPQAGQPDQAGYGAGPAAYLSLLEQAKASLSIPVIASLNGTTRGGWVRHAARLEQAGADALELNIYYVSSRPGLSGGEVEGNYLDVVREVRRAIGIPLAVKLSPYFSSLANLAGQLVEAGANGLVLFNRFYQPDIDIETMEVLPALELSSSAELRLPLRWIAILHRRWGVSLAASTGVHTAEDVVKVLLAGADVAMMTSALLHNGPDHLRPVELRLRDWMDRHRYETIDQLRGQPEPAVGPRPGRLRAGQLHQDPRLPHRTQPLSPASAWVGPGQAALDPPDDPTGCFSIRLDRRGIQREQARSVWSRPVRRRAPGHGSGGWAPSAVCAELGGDGGDCTARRGSVASTFRHKIGR